MQEPGESPIETRVGANCNLTFKFPESDREYTGLCLRLGGTEILFKTDQDLEVGRAIEIRIIPDHYACPAITAFVEIIQCNLIEKNHYEISATIKGIKAR
ncbi:MAG: hypothetical protein ACRERV_04130 [Methylococcales bacterium]